MPPSKTGGLGSPNGFRWMYAVSPYGGLREFAGRLFARNLLVKSVLYRLIEDVPKNLEIETY